MKVEEITRKKSKVYAKKSETHVSLFFVGFILMSIHALEILFMEPKF